MVFQFTIPEVRDLVGSSLSDLKQGSFGTFRMVFQYTIPEARDLVGPSVQ